MSEPVESLVAAMTLEEKVSLLAGEDSWHLPAVERLGIPRLKMTDGPNGARGEEWGTGPPSACFPCGSALAATFDTGLLAEVGRHLAMEAKAKRAHVLLGPTVNIHRHPLAGRHFECYSEDPELTARLAVAYIRGLQGEGVSACVKHFVANDSEFERMTISSEVPERALREVYLRPFEAAVTEAGTWSVMAAYNRVEGVYASEHPVLLRSILRDEWGFDGFVVSDWTATHSTVAGALAGLDVEMPGPTVHRGAALVAAVTEGAIEEKVIDGLVSSVLTVAERTGCLVAAGREPEPETAADVEERRALAHDVAAAGIVLLRNEPVRGAGGPLLPVDASAISRIAVIGPNSDPARIQGGGSAGVTPYYAVTPLQGIRARVGDGVEVVHARGGHIARSIPHIDLRQLRSLDGEQGLTVDHHDGPPGQGAAVLRQTVRRIPCAWPAPPAGVSPARWAMRLQGMLNVEEAGRHLIQVRATGSVTVSVDGRVVADVEAGERGARAEAEVDLRPGADHVLQVDLVPPRENRWAAAGFDIRHRAPGADDEIGDAVKAAAGADVAVVVVGTDNDWETEGRDRDSLDLPGRQVELIEAVAAANARTVVVLNTGAPVGTAWIDQVPAALQLWFAGQEAGAALASVLFGDVNPSGRLPTTIPTSLETTPAFTSYPGEFGRVDYGEGLFVGYRWYDARGITPAFPFGHGLSYTSFEYGTPTARVGDDGSVRLEVEVRNTGSRDGAEVVQVYVEPVAARVARPPRELKAFERVYVAAGMSVVVSFDLGHRAFAYWDPAVHGWRVDAGEYDLVVGASSRDLRCRTRIELDVPGTPA